ncbi:MAG: RNA-binding S4 domain-containing protein [Bifidobacteriaceae bacterium]|jgi:ribosome-associated heat shock protein Hsp15|nr:RNA-binding S4 domain-containing protein [Bifidobacteriaceae bacterium]
MDRVDKARVDSWLWAARLFKSRSLAAAACKAGHVRVRGEKAKPSHLVGPGDEVHVRGGPRERIVIVVKPLVKRVSAILAAEAYEDHSPPPPPKAAAAVPLALRERGSGRPTKAERRQLDRLRGRPSN